ncbi:MAG TPA: hypothetical protein VGP97_03680 [Burkholderiales bacterium]|jgi:hypothetical protein|nr:hypothetical protein [Burkholderiales bacterium]
MDYTIGADPEFLRVEVSGRDTDVPPSALCAQVLAESERLERPRILIELDQKFPLSLRSQQQLIDELPKIGFTRQHSIALVHRTPIAQMANQYIDMLAPRRDLSVRNFSDVEQAKDWLRTR